VLRESSGGYFKFIEECYVYGIRDGEAIEGQDLESVVWEIKWFHSITSATTLASKAFSNTR
jgi:hypothetical protein